MITVLPGEFPRLVGVEAGANAYLNKPFRMEEFLSCVSDLVGRPDVASEVLAGLRIWRPARLSRSFQKHKLRRRRSSVWARKLDAEPIGPVRSPRWRMVVRWLGLLFLGG